MENYVSEIDAVCDQLFVTNRKHSQGLHMYI